MISRLGIAAVALALVSPLLAQEQIRWRRTVAPDRAFSLPYPESWTVAHDRGSVSIRGPAAEEQIVVIRMVREAGKPPEHYANYIADLYRKSSPDFRLSNMSTEGDNAAFAVASGNLTGLGVIALHPKTAFWVSYTSGSAENIRRGGALVASVSSFITDDAESMSPPAISVSPAAARPTAAAPAPAPRPAAPPPAGGAFSAGVLVGAWGDTGVYGDLVNSATGTYAGSAYSGQSYLFNADGTYRYTIVGSGQFISGASITEGAYEVRSNQILLHQKLATWYPQPRSAEKHPKYKDKPQPEEKVLTIEWRGADLVVSETNGTRSTLHRQQPSK